MRKHLPIYGILAMLIIFAACSNESNKEMQKPSIPAPIAKKIPKELSIHGDTRIDNYYWLNERENPEVIAYLEAENEYKDTLLAHTKQFQEDLFNEMKGRIKEDDSSVPYLKNGYYYYSRYEEGNEYAINCRKEGSLDAEEEVMFNQNEMAEGTSYFAMRSRLLSDNNEICGFALDTVGRRIYEIKFKNLKTGEMLDDVIPNVTGNYCWAADNEHIFYARQDSETLRSYQIYKHKLGDDPANDELIYEENDEIYGCYVWRTKSDKFIIIGSYATLSSEERFLDASDPNGEFQIIHPREKELEYSVSHFEDKFYIRTNWDAKNFRLMEVSESNPAKENWTEVIPHNPDVYFEGMEIFNDYMVVDERKEGLTHLKVIPRQGEAYYLDFGEPVYMAYTSTNVEFDTKILRYGYSSLTTPSSIIDFDMSDKSKTLMKQQEVIGGEFNSENYVSERQYAVAKDGKKIPMSIVYRKDMKKDGGNPCLIYGYGSYGATIDPYFSSNRLSMLDRGFVFAIAHIRGSQIYGREWYEDGKFFNKKNTFTDFIACSEFLIENGYSEKDNLFALGGSAGGLLMGAIVNMRPDLYKGVIAAVPFVDVVTTMLDENIPLTTGEYDEWGNPNEKEYYDYMLSYSPYDQVKAQDYPNMLVTTGLHDSQVQYWEPAKWVAKLREMKTDDNILLLHTNMDAGHGGASGRFRSLKETAMEYAFMFDLAGIKE